MPATGQRKLKILVTGGTGFLGSYVVPLLRDVYEVSVLSRSNKTEVRGDLCQWNAGLDLEKLRTEKFDIFLHMAGLYDLTAAHVDCFQHNISAVGTALKVAAALEIPVFINTSSVAAAINAVLPTVKPYDLNFARPFPDPYAESKALGEQVIQNWPAPFRLKLNLRLGVLVGDTAGGKIARVDGPYHAPFAFERLRNFIEKFPTALLLPGSDKQHLPLVPVNHAAQAILRFCQWSTKKENDTVYKSFHLTPHEGLGVRELYLSTLKQLYIRNKGIKLVHQIPTYLIKQISQRAFRFPKEELSYLLHFPQYDSVETKEILGRQWCPEFREYEKAFWSGYEKYISNR